MSCCGKARAQASMGSAPQASTVQRPANGTVLLEYTGPTALSVVGPVSRITYTFGRPGARVVVDARDSISFATVRTLRRV